MPVKPGPQMFYGVALLLSLASGFPVWPRCQLKQVLRADPYQDHQSRDRAGTAGRRLTARDLLLGAQIAILRGAGPLSSMVAVRGLTRSATQQFLVFEPRKHHAGGYRFEHGRFTAGTECPQCKSGCFDAMQGASWCKRPFGLVNIFPPLQGGLPGNESNIFNGQYGGSAAQRMSLLAS